MNIHSIGRDKALALFKTGWWKNKTSKEISKFQLLTRELCMPFDKFHEALESALGRPVWTHELALNHDAIVLELFGEKDPPSMQEIMDLIPESKRIIIIS